MHPVFAFYLYALIFSKRPLYKNSYETVEIKVSFNYKSIIMVIVVVVVVVVVVAVVVVAVVVVVIKLILI